MKPYALWSFFMCTLVSMQMVDPAVLWAAEERSFQIDESRRVVIAAIDGTQLMLRNGQVSKVVQFREMVNVGESLTTGNDTMADLLIGNRAVVTMGKDTVLQLLAANPEQTIIQVTKGRIRIAAAASALGQKGVMTVQTPTGQVQTRGGILRVLVEAPVGKAEPLPMGEAKPYRAAYVPERLMAAGSSSSELIQVEEGIAEILGVGGKPVTLQTGQSITLRAGSAGSIGGLATQDGMRQGVVVTAGHSQTPKEGRDHLVALQVDQATQLVKRGMDPEETRSRDSEKEKKPADSAKTGSGESEKQSDNKNAINGATGGVTLINTLFGNGSTVNPISGSPLERTGSGYGGSKNNVFVGITVVPGKVPTNEGSALLVFTRKDPVEPFVKKSEPINGTVFELGKACDVDCLFEHAVANKLAENVGYRPYIDPGTQKVSSIASAFKVEKELILIGGTPNVGHGGTPPKEPLIVRGVEESNRSIFATDRFPADIALFDPTPVLLTRANSTFVVKNESETTLDDQDPPVPRDLVGGTLGQFSNSSTHPRGIVIEDLGGDAKSRVDGAITATTTGDFDRHQIVLSGGVLLDQGSKATISATEATGNFFNPELNPPLGNLKAEDARFSGSLLSVIKGPNNTPTVLTMQNRMLGVYDGSTVCIGSPKCEESKDGNKALLSVLDAKLIGPSGGKPLVDIAAGKHFIIDNSKETIEVTQSEGSRPSVTVTSAIVTRSTMPHSSLPLDGALLEASAPLFALTKATMTTTSHFADLAGNASQSLNLNGALVALSAADLVVKGNLLNLSSATAAITGYLFSLNNGSTLNINGGSLFKLDNSALTLTGNAFGVFGNGTNTLTIQNNLCGAGVACGTLVNSAHQPFTLANGTQLKVAGVDHNVVLPNSFNVFAGNAATKVDIGANAALFQLDTKSHLTINGTQVQ